MEVADTHYAKTADGVYIAYQVFGDGPIDVVWQSDWPGNIDVEMEEPLGALWIREVASFARVIFHDRRGIGLSSRNVALPNLETRVADLAGGDGRRRFGAADLDGRLRIRCSERAARGYQAGPRALDGVDGTEPPVRVRHPTIRGADTLRNMEAELRDIEHVGARSRTGDRWSKTRPLGATCCRTLRSPSWRRRAATRARPTSRRALAKIWYESDVRAILPTVQVPTTILTMGAIAHDHDRARYVASLIPGAELREIPGDSWTPETICPGRRGDPARRGGSDRRPQTSTRVLATVLFTDIVGSTEQLSALGDHEWRSILARHDERRSRESSSVSVAASRSTPPATASSRSSTVPPARSDVPRRSALRSATSGSRSARACTRAKWS